ncbi:MAG: hypothetical protein LIO93_04405, partial [Bacteroidales bacterium]|nr:hypothetical protein [Bacteroidales bacterium]
ICTSNSFNYDADIYPADFNVDGTTDFLVRDKTVNKVWLSTGDTLVESSWETITDRNSGIIYPLPWGGSGSAKLKPEKILMDINQDGRIDVISSCNFIDYSQEQVLRTNVKMYINNGNGFDEVFNNNYSCDTIFSVIQPGKFIGLSDKAVLANKHINLPDVPIFRISPGVKFNKIVSITDALGEKKTIVYGPVKTPVKQNANIKLRDGKYEVTSGLLSGIEVVTTIRGTLQNEAYLFEDPQFHWEGRGFLGFASTRVTDWINREYKKSKSNRDNTFHFLYPYKNSVEEMTNRIIHETTNYYRVIQGKNKRFELCLDSVSARDVLKNMSVKTTYSKYDTDRNPLSVKIDYGDGISITETYEYVSKASRFKNKLVSHTILQEAKNEKSITRTKKYSYDEKGNLIEEIADSQDNSSDIKENKRVWKYYKRYDEYGNPGSIITDASGIQHTKTFTYTSYGRFIQQETDSRIPGEISYTYDNARGLLKSKKDRYGTTSYEYDNFGTLKLTTYPDGIKTASVLRWAGNEPRPSGAVFFNHAETSGKGPMRIWYDKLGRELQTESYGLNSKKVLVDTKYNSQGRIQYVSEPYFQGSSTTQGATYVYDIYGRVSKLTTAMGTTNYSYSGRTTEITTPTGKKKTTVNAAGWVTEEKTNDKTVTFTHYANGAVKTATPQGGNSVAMKYDIQGNRTELNDPDAGTVFSKYNAWGQLIEEKQSVHNSSSSVITSHFYLDNGLLDYKDQNGIKTRYEYDSNNRVKKISMDQISQEFAYDSFDRIVSVKDNLGSGKVFTKTMEYDQLGRIEKEIYPSNYWISKRYDKYSLLTEITDQKGQKIWKAIEANAKGQLTKTQAGNKETVYTYNEKDFPIGIKTPGIVDMTYTFDGKWNNLNSRKDNLTGFEEVFTYDDLDRLQTWSVMGPNGVQAKWEQKYEADKTTITSKTAYGKDFKYGIGNIKPHALTSVVPETGTNFSADQTITYTDFKKMKTIKSGAYDLAVTYSVDQERIKTVLTKDKKNFTRYYLGNYEEEINSSGNVRKIHYINGGNGLAAAYIANQNGKDSLYYIHMDYQGSLIALSLPEGTVKEKYAYDPWGKRRNPANWSQIDKRTGFIVNRGYTMHEHLPEFNLINMNGRVYDPGAGLFFSPDPFIQAPDNWLNYNRYSYCMNNPLKYADPSGEFLISAIGLGIFMNIVTQDISNFKDFLFAAGIGALSGAAGYWGGSTVAGAIFQGGFVGGASIGIASGTVGSFVSGAGNSWMNGANFAQGLGAGLISGAKSGVTGAVTAGITRGLSDMINGYDFWDGTQINELSTGEFGVYERAGKAYNESWLAEYKDENLLNRIYEVYGVTPRNMKIEALTTKTTKGYGLTTEGKYIKPNGAISKGFTLHSSTGKVSVHISPFYAEGDIVHFRAVTGHELIHAYHYIKFHGNNFIREHSESVAYRYTYNVYNKAGYYSDALDTMNSAVKNGFWEVYRSEYMSMPHRTNFFKK